MHAIGKHFNPFAGTGPQCAGRMWRRRARRGALSAYS
jgi:hypothetical protein